MHVWRVDVGRVPLLLLDAELRENDPVQRWTTARLYEGNRAVRLAQYGLLGIGGVRALSALGIAPGVVHLNEGHPALAPLELAAERVAAGTPFEEALAEVRSKVVFTTHTPVPAGNERYERDELLGAFSDLPVRLGVEEEAFLRLCRVDPDDTGERPGMTALALRVSERRNAVSRLHGEVARAMWRPLFGVSSPEEVPIDHVTNGAHLPTFLGGSPPPALRAPPRVGLAAAPLRPPGVGGRARDPQRGALVGAMRGARAARAVDSRQERAGPASPRRADRVRPCDRPAGSRETCSPSVLRVASPRTSGSIYSSYDEERARRIFAGTPAVQLLIAGKAHPDDEEGKDALQRVYHFERANGNVAERIVFVEDYDLEIARQLVSGCDVWVNLPRRPMEASGTSGMKATFNGVLQLSVLDGWWAEAYDGSNGWAIPGDEDADLSAADARDAERFYDLLEHEVIPLFYERDDDGVPHRWCERIKAALATCAPRFTATRMLDEYAARMYPVR